MIEAALKGLSASGGGAFQGRRRYGYCLGAPRPSDRGARGRANKDNLGAKADPHCDFLLSLIETPPHLTISELLERLIAERGIKARRATLWGFLNRCGNLGSNKGDGVTRSRAEME